MHIIVIREDLSRVNFRRCRKNLVTLVYMIQIIQSGSLIYKKFQAPSLHTLLNTDLC